MARRATEPFFGRCPLSWNMESPVYDFIRSSAVFYFTQFTTDRVLFKAFALPKARLLFLHRLKRRKDVKCWRGRRKEGSNYHSVCFHPSPSVSPTIKKNKYYEWRWCHRRWESVKRKTFKRPGEWRQFLRKLLTSLSDAMNLSSAVKSRSSVTRTELSTTVSCPPCPHVLQFNLTQHFVYWLCLLNLSKLFNPKSTPSHHHVSDLAS